MADSIEKDPDFIYSRRELRELPVTLELVEGGYGRTGRVWDLLARQVWAEHAPDGSYRTIGHSESGAPLLVTDSGNETWRRISVSHTKGMLAIATLERPVTPELDPENFCAEAALGIDVERADRDKAVAVRRRFLSPGELPLAGEDDTAAHVLAWTCKEAMLKLALNPSADIREDLRIESLPVFRESDGKGIVRLPDGHTLAVGLHSLRLGPYILTVATLQPEYLL